MASMGKQSLTKKAWRAQGCVASEVQFIGRKAKRAIKGRNARTLRQQAKKEASNRKDQGNE